ncbi:MAG TPA: DUF1428 domain-containing protein [Terriglobales bacterium]|nr:DUF1428 domain-containing protein [Terriglobales bacterium]
MAKYVDGFILPVPKKNLKAYHKMAKLGAKVWKEYGALEYFESYGDDMAVKFGVPFPKLVKPKQGEVIVFSWIVYKSRAHRDKVNAKVMKDKRMNTFDPKKMPFDLKRMAWGGFEVMVQS